MGLCYGNEINSFENSFCLEPRFGATYSTAHSHFKPRFTTTTVDLISAPLPPAIRGHSGDGSTRFLPQNCKPAAECPRGWRIAQSFLWHPALMVAIWCASSPGQSFREPDVSTASWSAGIPYSLPRIPWKMGDDTQACTSHDPGFCDDSACCAASLVLICGELAMQSIPT
jgi:hypothetical protein